MKSMTKNKKSTKKYHIAMDCQPGCVKRQFEEVKKLSRLEAPRSGEKAQFLHHLQSQSA